MKKVITPIKLFPRGSTRRVPAEEAEMAGGPPDSINPVSAAYEDPQEPNQLPDLIKDTEKKDEGENDTTSNPTGPGQDVRISKAEWDQLKKEAEAAEAAEAAEGGEGGEGGEIVNVGDNLVEQNQVLNENQDFNYGGDLAGGFSVDQSLILMDNFTRLAEVVGKILTSQKKAATPSSGPFPS